MKDPIKLFLLAIMALSFATHANSKAKQTKEHVTLLTKIEQSDSNGVNVITTITYNDQNQPVKMYYSFALGGEITYSMETKFYYVEGKLSGTSSFNPSRSDAGKDSSKVELDSQGHIVEATFYRGSKGLRVPNSIYRYTWSGDKFTEIKDLKDDEIYPIVYINGNVSLLEDTMTRGSVKYTATFDNKKNPYTSLVNMNLALFSDMPGSVVKGIFLLSYFNTNNILQSKVEGEDYHKVCNYAYEYNSDGYVTKAVETNTQNSDTSTTIYTYTKNRRLRP